MSWRRCIWVESRLRKRELQSNLEWTMEVARVEAVLESSMGRMRRRSRMCMKQERERLEISHLHLHPLLHRLFRLHLASVRPSGMQDLYRISLPSLGRLFSIATLTSSRLQKPGIGDLMMFLSAELLHLDSPSVNGLDHFLLMFLRRKEVAL